ncbi:2OG-Fe(II) oxygenase [Metabacillus litoralis]|uniref:2OG-Fe(II) oxygenase n=1 Tax=Metabacillus litoralis TaxID=152268 RepID=UPI00203C51E3|nr:2OG-Fe(II) oxygenase [Metabacillus litoralis]MCM3651375.1 2OG-Fe(II) oxygenase [Metabacillus litoralis]
MTRYRFGNGEYKYFPYSPPEIFQSLRESFYPELAKTANRWLGYFFHYLALSSLKSNN